MSVEAIAWVFRLELPPCEKIQLLSYADRADERGMCFPCVRDTAERTGLTERTVRNINTRLVQADLMTVVPWRRADGSQTANRYVLHIGSAGNVNLRPAKKITREGAMETIARIGLFGEDEGPGDLSLDEEEPMLAPRSPALSSDDRPLTVNQSSEEPSLNHVAAPNGATVTRKAKEPQKRKSRIPDDWTASPSLRKYAEDLGFDPDRQADAFLSYHAGKGTLWVDWDRAFQYWCRTSADRASTRQRPSESGSLFSAAATAPADPNDPYGAENWAASIRDQEAGTIEGKTVRAVAGYDVVGCALDICRAADIDESARPDLSLVEQWLRAGFDPDSVARVIQETTRRPDRPNLRWYDGRVREHAKRVA